LAVVFVSGSVALLADTIHNVGDHDRNPTMVRLRASASEAVENFTYGLGRAEGLAGILIVLIILFSAVLADYGAISRLMHLQPVHQLGWLTVAGFVGFVGNEIVAVFRIRAGREMNSVALIAEGYHARTDGLTSLAVVLDAFGVWIGFSARGSHHRSDYHGRHPGHRVATPRAVVTRMLDGVSPVLSKRSVMPPSTCPASSRWSTPGRGGLGTTSRPMSRSR
jgi:predicted Co/Zn/Cd cation transporter (cation efflux family)